MSSAPKNMEVNCFHDYTGHSFPIARALIPAQGTFTSFHRLLPTDLDGLDTFGMSP